jgi:hypothetical protein
VIAEGVPEITQAVEIERPVGKVGLELQEVIVPPVFEGVCDVIAVFGEKL